jgi:hypothetical protein
MQDVHGLRSAVIPLRVLYTPRTHGDARRNLASAGLAAFDGERISRLTGGFATDLLRALPQNPARSANLTASRSFEQRDHIRRPHDEHRARAVHRQFCVHPSGVGGTPSHVEAARVLWPVPDQQSGLDQQLVHRLRGYHLQAVRELTRGEHARSVFSYEAGTLCGNRRLDSDGHLT